jgi:hypothetical protein
MSCAIAGITVVKQIKNRHLQNIIAFLTLSRKAWGMPNP